MNPRYQQIHDGEWTEVFFTENFDACCDCGLIHRTKYRLIKSGKRLTIEQKVHREQRKTRDMRKRMGIKIVKVKK